MPLSDIVQVSITSSGAGLSLPGFGVPLILGGYSKAWQERVRFYSDLLSVSADFAPGTPEHLAAAAIFGQNPHPDQVAIGRCAAKPTQRWTITPAAVLAQHVTTFGVKIAGKAYEFVSDANPTAVEVVAGLLALINVDTGTHGLVATGDVALVLTSNTAGAWQFVEVENPALLRIVEDHADPGIAADLDAIRTETDNWYAIVNPWNSTAEVLAIAAWAEANEKLFVAAVQETQIIDTADAGATDIAHALKAAAYFRAALVYSPNNGEFLDAALLGRCLPENPGSETWALKTLAGPTARALTGTNLVNLQAKNCGYYYAVAGRNITMEGKAASGEFIDVVRFRDWQKVDMQGRLFLALANARKVPFTDAGAAVVQGAVQASLSAGVSAGGLVKGTTIVTVPKVADVSVNDRANRLLPGVTFTATLAGAIHKIQIQGTVSV